MVRATPQEHGGLADQIRVWDRQENQIQINTYVVEISKNDDLFGGVDWSNTLGQNGATFTLTGNVGATPDRHHFGGIWRPVLQQWIDLKISGCRSDDQSINATRQATVDELASNLHQNGYPRSDQECYAADDIPANGCHRKRSGDNDAVHLHHRPNYRSGG